MSRIWLAWALALLAQLWITDAAKGDIPSNFEVGWLKVPIDGREFRLAVHVFRPNGDGPFPLVVINHGTPVSITDARKQKPGFGAASAWFAEQGYIVGHFPERCAEAGAARSLREGCLRRFGSLHGPVGAGCTARTVKIDLFDFPRFDLGDSVRK